MRDIYEVLREKENSIKRVRREVEALRSVTRLLADETGARSNSPELPVARRELRTGTVTQQGGPSTATPLPANEMDDVLAAIRTRAIEAAEAESTLGTAKRISRELKRIAAPLLGS